MSGRLWILGASDPEMEMIESLLRDAGEEVAYAVGEDGRQVHPGNAYQAAGVRFEEADHWYSGRDAAAWGLDEDEGFPRAYLVECAVAGGPDDVVVIDHHRPGDPGYGRGPDEFLPASSVGQVVSELARLGKLPAPKGPDWRPLDAAGWRAGREPGAIAPYGAGSWCVRGRDPGVAIRIPYDIVLTAAADHCPAAAYQGKCEGVTPDDLMRWRAKQRAKQRAAFQGRKPEDVIADVESAAEALLRAERVAVCTDDHDGSSDDPRDHPPLVADLRGECDSCRGVGVTHGEEQGKCRACSGSGLRVVPELPEAALRMGVAYLANVPDRSGRTKVVLGGAGEGTRAGPAPIRAFLGGWAEGQGLVDLYGDLARGFAGGYER